MRFIQAALAAFIAGASLASAADECNSSISCTIGAWACTKLCERRGHTAGGSCLPRDGCPGQQICACYPAAKRDLETIDDEELAEIDEILGGQVPAEEFVDAVLEEPQPPTNGTPSAAPEEGGHEERAVEKRSLCCSLIPPFKGLCCEQSCYHAGYLEGGQCTNHDVCTCG